MTVPPQSLQVPSLVGVVESGSGTGVIFKIDGNNAYIVTNNHVVENAQEIHITVNGGEETTAELIGTDPLTDTAVLKIDSKYATSVLEFGDSSSLRAGDQVYAIGNPLDPLIGEARKIPPMNSPFMIYGSKMNVTA